MARWDVFILILMVFTATVTPYEVAFCESDFNVMYGINRFVDLGFIVDMVFNFFLGYINPKTNMCWVWRARPRRRSPGATR